MANHIQDQLIQMVQLSLGPIFLCDHTLKVLAYSQSFYKSLGYFDDDIHTLFDSNTIQRIKRSGKSAKPMKCKTKNLPFQLQVNINWIGSDVEALMLGVVEKNYIHPAVDSMALAYSCMDRLNLTQKILVNQLHALQTHADPERLNSILSQTDTLSRDCENLQDCINILTDTMILDRIDTDLNRILRRTLLRIQNYTKEHNIRIIYEAPKSPIMIHGDLKQMIRTIGDCLHNVLYFSQKDHHIQISVIDDTDHCTIEMVNPLFKIPDIGIRNLFTRHAIMPQGDDHAGLYFANTIIGKHGGKLEFDDSPRYGYKLILTIPKSSVRTIQFNDIDDSAFSNQIDRYLERSFFDM